MHFSDEPVLCEKGRQPGFKVWIGDLTPGTTTNEINTWLSRSWKHVCDIAVRLRWKAGPGCPVYSTYAVITADTRDGAAAVHAEASQWWWKDAQAGVSRYCTVKYVLFL